MINKQYFTLVFEGSIYELPANPFDIETVFGKVVAARVGDALANEDDAPLSSQEPKP